MLKAIYTTGEAAECCYVSQQTIIRCFDKGTLGGFRVPGTKYRRIPRESLVKFAIENGIPLDRLQLTDDERRKHGLTGVVIGPIPVNRLGELLSSA